MKMLRRLRTRWQISLSGLFIVMSVICVGLAGWRYATRESRAIAELQRTAGVHTVLSNGEPHREVAFRVGSDVALEPLTRIRNVWYICLWGTEVDDADLRWLCGMNTLTDVELGYTKVGDDGARHIARLAQLEYLDMSHTKVSDHGLRSLSKCKRLDDLVLRGTSVSDRGLLHLKKLPRLRSLNVYGTNVTASGVEDLKLSLRRCRIYWDGGVL